MKVLTVDLLLEDEEFDRILFESKLSREDLDSMFQRLLGPGSSSQQLQTLLRRISERTQFSFFPGIERNLVLRVLSWERSGSVIVSILDLVISVQYEQRDLEIL